MERAGDRTGDVDDGVDEVVLYCPAGAMREFHPDNADRRRGRRPEAVGGCAKRSACRTRSE
jgi:hypothetical protein